MSEPCIIVKCTADGIPQESNTELYRPALETLRTLIRTSTSSMTSVPKPLKFLLPHYPIATIRLQELYEIWPPSEDTRSVSAIVFSEKLTYFLESLRRYPLRPCG